MLTAILKYFCRRIWFDFKLGLVVCVFVCSKVLLSV